ncbi:SprT family protein [Alkalihalobacillus sp. BA299]|uniref:SprT family protein n=1 Tax=Alkalihalobacillus sp. BA299 TaxID=2815938 RepID=UPI001ADC10F1|nr:SprT family protein [Alkalihalobacillus sp. BA299]
MTQEELQFIVEEVSLSYFKRPFLHEARFNPRLRTTGGRYLLHTHDIEINPKQYEAFGKEELISIIKHELCHYHLHIQKRGYKHRDKDFKDLLSQVGGARYCKSLSNERISSKRRYTIECTSCSIKYIRKRKLNLSRYACGRCGGKLRMIKMDIDH